MGYQPLEKLLPKAGGSIYKLVVLASKRATELADGMPKLIEFPSSKKATTIALEEIMAGKVEIKTSDQAGKADKKEEKKKGKKE